MDKKIKPCPFCGKNDVFIFCFDTENHKWALDHYCSHANKGEGLSVTIDVYGNSKEDVIEKWNKRIGEK